MASKLTAYRAKRDPKKTPEPIGSPPARRARGPAARTFVIQEHHARTLHWDFRLEHDGVLASWALPEGLPVDPKSNRLAVQTEDHPLDYAKFEGDIPKGEYGGGHVCIWDHGTYELVKWRDNEVMVDLHGERAEGRYVLFPTGGKNWMIHRMDPAPAGFEPMPELIKPMLAKAGGLPRTDEGWAYEFKWDGVRAIVYVDGGRVRALTRNDRDVTTNFPELRDIGAFLGSRPAVLDGEIVAFDDGGRPNFASVAHRLHVSSKALVARLAKETPVSFLAFDLLYLDGHSTVALPYDHRRELLEALKLDGTTFATPPSMPDGDGADILAVAKDRGLEGIVIKRRDSHYAAGRRNGEWLKVKNFRTQEVVIGGWTDGQQGLAGNLGALLLGVPSDLGLEYAGKVGTGFTDSGRRQLLDRLAPLSQAQSPFRNRLAPSETRAAHFVRPEIVGEVQYGQWTSDGHLRHASWRGLRSDKDPNDVVREC